MSVHVVQQGQGDLDVVFLHGFMGSGADWEPISGALPAVRSWAVDLPGHGQSPVVNDGDPFDSTLDAILRALPPLFVLVGYSLGARLALQLALRAPHRVTSLVVESGNPGIRHRAQAAERLALDRGRARALRTTPYRFVFNWSAQPLLASGREAADVQAQEDRRLAHLRTHGPAGWAWAVEALSVGRQRSCWPQLAAIQPPTLIVNGANDKRYTRIGAAMVKDLPNARQLVVTGAGHNVHLEQPDIFVEVLEALLTDCAPARAPRPLRPVSPR